MPKVVPEGCVSVVMQTIGVKGEQKQERGLRAEQDWAQGASLPITMVGDIMLLADIFTMYGDENSLPAFPGWLTTSNNRFREVFAA